MAFLQFKKGAFASLPTDIREGTIYVTTDEKAMYVDVDSETRIRLGQIVNFANLEKFKEYLNTTNPPYSTEAFYYIEAENALLKWKSNNSNTTVDGEVVAGEWVQINTTADVESLVTNLDTRVNANATAIAGLQTTVNTIAGDYLKSTDKTALEDKISDAQDAADAAQTTIDNHINGAFSTLSGTVTGLVENKADKTALAEVKATAEQGVADAAVAKSAADAAQGAADNAQADATQALADAAKVADDLAEYEGANNAIVATLATKTELTEAVNGLKNNEIKANADAISAEKSRAEGEEAKIREEFAAVDTTINGRIDGVANNVAGLQAAVGAEGKDGASSGLYLYAEQQAAAAEQAAKTHAEQKASAAETAAKEYADEVATTAKSEAIADANGKFATVNASIENITKADGLIAQAEARAAADATSKADKAKEDAISAAATDATTKANNAKDAAIADANGKFATVNATIGSVGSGETASTGLYLYAEQQAAAAETAAKEYVDRELRMADAMTFKGILGTGEGMIAKDDMPAAEDVKAGDTYKIGEADTYAGIVCYVGDLLIATNDGVANYVRVSSGYEDDYDATLDASIADKKIVLTNGVGGAKGSVVFAAAEGASVVMTGSADPVTKVSNTTVTIGMEWGTF